MKIPCEVIALLLGSFIASFGCAAEPKVELLTSEKSGALSHSVAAETAAMRKHHLRRLADRFTLEPAVLHQTCRYESEISTAPPANKVVLSFDDGPQSEQTEFILDVLKRHQISGTFFLIGQKAKEHPELVTRIWADGRHTVGNHSWSHPNFHEISVEEQAMEVLKYEEAPSIGPTPKLFRYPYGNSSCETNNLLHDRGYRIVGWHIDSCDWAFDKAGSVDAKEALSCGVLSQNRDNFVEHVVSSVRAHKGGIVLMHEIHPNTLKKLDEIITRLKEDGFVFGSIEDSDFIPDLR